MVLEAAEQFGVRRPRDIFKEKYALYSSTFPSPAGYMNNCFSVGDYPETEPRIDGVTVYEDDFETRFEVELDLSVCTPSAATGIICKLTFDGDFGPK